MKFFSSSLSLEGRVRRASHNLAAGFAALAMASFMYGCSQLLCCGRANAHSPWVATWGAAMVATDSGRRPRFYRPDIARDCA